MSEIIEIKKQNMARKEARRRRRRRKNLGCISVMLIFVLVVVFWILSFTIFFKIENIIVEGDMPYPEEVILAQAESEICIGQNLLSRSSKKVTESLSGLPYIESATIKRKLPSTARIVIKRVTEAYCIVSEEGLYTVISDKGKIIEIDTFEVHEGVMQIKGIEVEGKAVGEHLESGKGTGYGSLTTITNAIAENNFENITLIDVTNPQELRVMYTDRIEIFLGTEENVDYKLKFAKTVIESNLTPDEVGIIDTSIDSKVIFRPTLKEELMK